jgi:hypothetical protein
MNTDKHVVHSITADCEYYIARVGRRLEVRSQHTHTVLQVIEPPAEWGDNWLWSSCGFDGLRCVASNWVRLVRTESGGASAEGTASARKTRGSPPDPPQITHRSSAAEGHTGQGQRACARYDSAPSSGPRDGTIRGTPPGHCGEVFRSRSTIHAGVSLT